MIACGESGIVCYIVGDTKKPNFSLVIDKNSLISPEEQVMAQLKIAIMLGTLKPGQALPSVRQLEKQSGVGRNIIWRAYSGLARSGAIELRRRRHAVVSSNIYEHEATALAKVCDWLGRDILKRLEALRINPHSFLRFLTQRVAEFEAAHRDIIFVECNAVQAKRFSKEISELWRVPVPGMEIKDLQGLSPVQRLQISKVLTPLYHYEEVLEVCGNVHSKVIPLRLDWNTQLIQELQALPPGSRMAFVLEKSECRDYGDALARSLNYACPKLEIEICCWRDAGETARLIHSGKYQRLLLSGVIWDEVPEETKNSPLVVQRALEINRRSLEEARIQAGVIL